MSLTRRLPVILFVAVALTIGLPNSGDSKGGADVAVVFSPTGEERHIHKAIIAEIESARTSIDVAIFQFTSVRLARALAIKSSKVRVRVLFDRRTAAQTDITQAKLLQDKGVAVKFVKLPGKGFRAAKFHHKYAVIDEREVLTGSYNWTVGADEINYENLVVIREKRIAKQFAENFEKIWNDESVVVDSRK